MAPWTIVDGLIEIDGAVNTVNGEPLPFVFGGSTPRALGPPGFAGAGPTVAGAGRKVLTATGVIGVADGVAIDAIPGF